MNAKENIYAPQRERKGAKKDNGNQNDMQNNPRHAAKEMCTLCMLIFLFFSSFASAFDPIFHIGNDERYINCIAHQENSPLKNKKILFLGSSVTRGATSRGISFADMLARKYGFTMIKDAVDGTTLVEEDSQSYVSRLKNYNQDDHIDLMCVQLSTNDAWRKYPLKGEGLEQKSVEGAIKFIAEWGHKVLKCPVVFYTCPFFHNPRYEAMVDLLRGNYSISSKITVIDIYHDGRFNGLSAYEFGLNMYDDIHPTLAGYYRMTVIFEEQLLPFLL